MSNNAETGGIRLDFSQVGLPGRDAHTSTLRTAYEKVCNGDKSRSIFVKGVSGTGKSALVSHAFKEEVGDGQHLFVSGKYDQSGSSKQPYSALADAFSDLFDSIEAMKNDELNKKIVEALGGDEAQLAEIIPSLANILPNPGIKEETSHPPGNNRSVKSGWAFERLKINFRSILETVTGYTTVVLFLDDLQWADMAVLDLIQFLQDSSIPRYLFVGAYRDDGCKPDGTVACRLQTLVEHPNATSLLLSNLDLDDLNNLISTLIRRSPADAMPLTEVIFRKTDGNVFFAIEFLHLLQRSSLLYYAFTQLEWQWDITKIKCEVRLSGNVVDLVSATIQSLSGDVQRCLQVAACLGSQFDAHVVDEIVDFCWKDEASLSLDSSWYTDEDELSNQMLESSTSASRWDAAVKSRLIDQTESKTGDIRFRFAHDRIQEAALSLLVEGKERLVLHLRIGRFLLRQYNCPKKSQEWMLLVAVNQLNRSSTLINNPKEQIELAELNLRAAERTASKSAFFPAADLLKTGLGLLGETKWADHYELALRIATKSAECEYCCGRFEVCKTRVAEVLIQAKTLQDKIGVHFILIESLGAQKKENEALDVGLSLLGDLGFKFPKKVGVRHLLGEYVQAKRMLKGRTDDQLVRLPVAVDMNSACAVKVLTGLTTFAWFGGKMEMFALLIIRMFKLSLKYGATAYTASAYSMFGVVLSKFFELKEAQRMGKLGMRVLERFGNMDLEARVVFITNGFLTHLASPLHQLLNPFVKSHESGLKSGDLAYGMIASSAYCICYFLCGLPLKALDQDAENFAIEMRKYNQLTALSPCVLHHQAALNLMGESVDPLRLQGRVVKNIDAFLTQGTEIENDRTDQVYTALMMQLSFYMGDFTLGAEMARQNLKHKDDDFPFFIATIYPYWRGLIYYALVQQGQKKYLRRARTQLRLLEKYVKGGLLNCHFMLLLLQAEDEATTFLQGGAGNPAKWFGSKRAAINKSRDDQSQKIRRLYESAIQVAARSGFSQASALANERAGLFANQCQCPSTSWWASVFLNKASELYNQWGATIKVEQLKRDYEDLMRNEDATVPLSSHIKGRARFDPNSTALHHSEDCFRLSEEEDEDSRLRDKDHN